MASEIQVEKISGLTGEVLSAFPEIFLIRIFIKPTNNIKIFVDTDAGISIDNCIKVNRGLYKRIEEEGLFPEGDFSLEVSSPGIGEPLLLTRQYQKNVGRSLSVRLKEGQQLIGNLQACTEDGIILETRTGKGKKEVVENHTILFDEIQKAVVEVKF
jgi:ribosome maturation factor RimP